MNRPSDIRSAARRSGAGALLLLVLLFASAPLHAQDGAAAPPPPARMPLHLGIGAGIFYGMHSGGFAYPEPCADCGRYGDATGVGTALDLRISIPLARWLRLEPRLSGECHRGVFTSDPIETVIIGSGLEPQSLQFEDEMTYTLRLAGIDLLAAVSLGSSGVSVLAGPTVGFRVTETATVTERILSPDGATFLDGSRERTAHDGDIELARGLHAGIRAGLGWTLPLGRDLALGVEATWRLPLQTVQESGDWKTSGLRATVAVMFLI